MSEEEEQQLAEEEEEEEYLEPWVEQELLQSIEKSNKLRSQVNLLSLCNSSSAIFGPVASKRRRCIQTRFANLKRKTIQSYADYLDSKEVQHGPATLRELRQLKLNKLKSDGEEEDKQETASVSSIPDKQETSTSASASSVSTPTQSNKKTVDHDDLPILFSPIISTIIMNNDTATNNTSGTSSDPHIINVNAHSEKNREFGVQEVEGIFHNGYKRRGWHIRCNISIQDQTKWTAKVQHIVDDPDLAKRSIRIRGPSMHAWEEKADEMGAKIKCEATTEFHKQTVGEIAADDERQFTHWLVVFPIGTILENSVLSKDPFQIDMKIHGITEIYKAAEFRTVTANWRIVDKLGGRRLEPQKGESDLKDIF
jgi:hypothetical protein